MYAPEPRSKNLAHVCRDRGLKTRSIDQPYAVPVPDDAPNTMGSVWPMETEPVT